MMGDDRRLCRPADNDDNNDDVPPMPTANDDDDGDDDIFKNGHKTKH